MVMNKPLTFLRWNSILLLNEARAQLPTFGKMALNSARWFSSRVLPRSNTARKMYHGVRNWYEAGWPLWTGGAESYLPSLVQDARWDQNFVTRREMLRRMRYWSQNSPIIESILSVGERYTVGAAGLHVSFYPDDDLSEDADNSWYEQADRVVAEWFQDCGWNGETMAELLKIAYRDQKVDGEIFAIKTRKAGALNLVSRTIRVQKPCLQLIEAHRVESPWNQFEQEQKTLIDGVQYEAVNQDGRQMLRKTGFWMRSGASSFEQNDSWKMVPIEQCWQLRNVHRVDQPRSVSDFYAGEVTINKLEDLLEIEMKAAAAQNVRAVGVETASGQFSKATDPKIELFNRARGLPTPPPQGDEGKRFEVFRKETGAYVYGLKLGEKIHFDSGNRPSEATLNLWEYLVGAICAAAHAPRCLVFQKISGQSARSQGTEVRAELDAADEFYKGDFQKWKNFLREAVVWFMEWAINNDPRVADPPGDWKFCIHIQQPEACNVDIGYTTQADCMRLAAGLSDYDMILGRQGLSAISVFKKLKRQQAFMEKNNIKVTLPALLPGQIELEAPKEPEKEPANA
jgi:hypothetical protein